MPTSKTNFKTAAKESGGVFRPAKQRKKEFKVSGQDVTDRPLPEGWGRRIRGAALQSMLASRAAFIETHGQKGKLANFMGADLRGGDFRGRELSYAIFWNSQLDGASFTGAQMKHTGFDACDLRDVKGIGATTLRQTRCFQHARLPERLFRAYYSESAEEPVF
jgi:uncharacterized protein YjbI with pentapeptide repeats